MHAEVPRPRIKPMSHQGTPCLSFLGLIYYQNLVATVDLGFFEMLYIYFFLVSIFKISSQL